MLNQIAKELTIEQYVLGGHGFECWRYEHCGEFVVALIGAIYVDAKRKDRDWETIIRAFMAKYWSIVLNKKVEFRGV